MTTGEVVKGFKATDADIRCRGYQFTPGVKHVHEGNTELCNSGFHFCEDALDVLSYYPSAGSRFWTVDAEGVASGESNGDSKRAGHTITLGAEVGIAGLVKASIEYRFARATKAKGSSATGDRGAASATGYRGAASATGYQGAASATGDRGAASATGYQGAASATGDRGAASATGYQGAASALHSTAIAHADGVEASASGVLGAWLTLSEWKRNDATWTWERINVKAVRVDGKRIKADTHYLLKGGKVVNA